MRTFFTLQAVKGQVEFNEVVRRGATRESVIARHPDTVFIIDVTPYVQPAKCPSWARKPLVVLDFCVLGQAVTIGLHGNRTSIVRALPRHVVEGSVVASHSRVLRRLARS